MHDKRKLTEELYKHLDFDDLSIEGLYNIMWKNIRSESGFRLTSQGYTLLSKHLDLERYTINFDVVIVLGSKTLLDLDRKLKHPYYIDLKKFNTSLEQVSLVLFDSKEAMLANLYGDLHKFLDNYS